MRQHCGTDYNAGHGCGRVFDDAERMTLCPHPRLDDPFWREQIETGRASTIWEVVTEHVNPDGSRTQTLVSSTDPNAEIGKEWTEPAQDTTPSGHRCIACGREHAGCCGQCPEYRAPLLTEEQAA